MKQGIDVSAYQSNIDWSMVNAEFVIIKAAEFVYKDSCAGQHTLNARANNKKVSYYYFAHPNNSPDVVTDANNAAEFFYNSISAYGAPDFAVALDLEVNPNNLSPSDIEAWVNAFVAQMATHNLGVMLYGSPYFLDQNLPDGHSLGTLPLWLSEYNGLSNPTVFPKGWVGALIWQNSNNGTDGGVTVDTNVAGEDLYE